MTKHYVFITKPMNVSLTSYHLLNFINLLVQLDEDLSLQLSSSGSRWSATVSNLELLLCAFCWADMWKVGIKGWIVQSRWQCGAVTACTS